MTRLGLTLPASPRETPTDYLSRLSARNLAPGIWSFSGDCGLDFAALSTGDQDAVAHLCAIASLPPDSFAGRTVIKTSSMRYLLGSEVLNTETLSRGEIRFCPTCVREALESGARPWDVIHELHWQFIQIRHCCRHGTALQSHRFALDRTSRFDFTTLIRDAEAGYRDDPVVSSGAADALDHYLTARAYGAHGENWCNRLEIPALIKACEAFGTLIEHGRDMRASSLSAAQRRDAMLTGFEVLRHGRDGIWSALDRFNGRVPTRGGNQPHPRYGSFQRLLGSHCKMRADLDPVRDLVREYFLDHYPFRPGSIVLGWKIAESRVFSIRSACREIGIRRSLLEEILIRRGHAHRDGLGQFQLDVVLSRRLVDDIGRERQDYLDQNQTAEFLGCSFAMFKQLQRAGILRPAEGEGHWKRKGFHRPALQAFLNQLGQGASRLAKPAPPLCTLDLATRKANCSTPDIIRLMLDGRLRAAARLSDQIRLDSLLIKADELVRLLGATTPNGFSLNAVRQRLYINARTSTWLIENGYLDTGRFRHSITRVTRDYITFESLARFEAEYITIGQLARSLSTSSQKLRRDMRLIGAAPLTKTKGVRTMFRRNDLTMGVHVQSGPEIGLK